jgi:hypothetical protein
MTIIVGRYWMSMPLFIQDIHKLQEDDRLTLAVVDTFPSASPKAQAGVPMANSGSRAQAIA